MQLSTSLLLLSFCVDQLRVKLSQQVPGGPLGSCFQVLVFLKNPRLYEGWATYVQNKAGILREVEMCWLEKAQRSHIQSPADQWKDVQRPNLMKHETLRNWRLWYLSPVAKIPWMPWRWIEVSREQINTGGCRLPYTWWGSTVCFHLSGALCFLNTSDAVFLFWFGFHY